jgi:hypothetical protein
MKKKNVRTQRKYSNGKTKFIVEVKTRGAWRQAWTKKSDPRGHRPLIYDLEYDACCMLLSAFERKYI